MNGTDFLLADMVVIFDLNSTVTDRHNATVSINEDGVLEGAHNFNVSTVAAFPTTNVVVGSPSSAVIIIGDNDGECKSWEILW